MKAIEKRTGNYTQNQQYEMQQKEERLNSIYPELDFTDLSDIKPSWQDGFLALKTAGNQLKQADRPLVVELLRNQELTRLIDNQIDQEGLDSKLIASRAKLSSNVQALTKQLAIDSIGRSKVNDNLPEPTLVQQYGGKVIGTIPIQKEV